MFYVFLDFDGVTHPASANERYFREENIHALEAALDNYDASIVVSSTWRLDKSLNEIRTLLGPKLGEMVMDVTPEVDDSFLHNPRQAEAELYLSQDGVEQWPWVAVDDTPGFYREDAPVVFTDSQTGFRLSDVSAFSGVVDGLLRSSTRT
ncbi:MAG: HAD domain-containing protein [Gammaproteobacteria bacterium]|nr:HAD domain-containing protein [Gammaproteobacteria bacterium]MCW8839876.1 HAD domain-containing protein [Gammaproteobacteria bacterium]MCW8958918.1 HAD domain-containing protein [Gammaproteobacteria bacterium]MCW8992408.1 HAD domain-containing protein [Gammaproteobacteria bacterium]